MQADQAEGDATKVREYLETKHWVKGKVIGTGAYCTCFLAKDVKSGTIMAVKQVGGVRWAGSSSPPTGKPPPLSLPSSHESPLIHKSHVVLSYT